MAGQHAKYSADFSFLRWFERYCCFDFDWAIDSDVDLDGSWTVCKADDIALSRLLFGEESILNIFRYYCLMQKRCRAWMTENKWKNDKKMVSYCGPTKQSIVFVVYTAFNWPCRCHTGLCSFLKIDGGCRRHRSWRQQAWDQRPNHEDTHDNHPTNHTNNSILELTTGKQTRISNRFDPNRNLHPWHAKDTRQELLGRAGRWFWRRGHVPWRQA